MLGELGHKVTVHLDGRAPGQHALMVAAQRHALVVAPAALVRVEDLVAYCLTRLQGAIKGFRVFSEPAYALIYPHIALSLVELLCGTCR